MHQFIVTLQHDRGKIAISCMAYNAAQAANAVLNFEGAPVSAILSIEERELARW